MAEPDAKSGNNWPVRIILLLVCAAYVGWTVLETEHRVSILLQQGFEPGGAGIESVRNHAYWPMIGGIVGSIVGALLFVAIRKVIRNAMK